MEFSELLKCTRNLASECIVLFIERYSALIASFIKKRVHPNDTEDALQEFFYHILKVNLFVKFGGSTEDEFKAYLVKSAINFSFDWRKKQFKINEKLQVFDAQNTNHWQTLQCNDSTYEDLVKQDLSNTLNEAIWSLDIQYRRVMELKLLNYSNSEIATILEQPLGSINTWYSRGLKILAEKFKKLNININENGVL